MVSRQRHGVLPVVDVPPGPCAAQSGDEFLPGLDLLRGREVQAVPQHFPPALNGVQVWRLLGVARDHRATRASQSQEISLLPEALLVVLDEMHRFVVLEACPSPHGELVCDQPFVPVPVVLAPSFGRE